MPIGSYRRRSLRNQQSAISNRRPTREVVLTSWDLRYESWYLQVSERVIGVDHLQQLRRNQAVSHVVRMYALAKSALVRWVGFLGQLADFQKRNSALPHCRSQRGAVLQHEIGLGHLPRMITIGR